MKGRILFVVPYPFNSAPSQRLKFEQYYSIFKQNGFEITHKSFIGKNLWKVIYKKGFYFTKFLLTIISYIKRGVLLFSIRKYDIVYVHLWCTPFGPALYEWILKKLSRKLIYDLDDMVHLGNTSEQNKIISILKSNSKVEYLAKNADHIFTSTHKLVEYLYKYNLDISLIPATIDTNRYIPSFQEEKNEICIGWSGSQTTSKYLHLLDEVLKDITSKHPVKILVMGDPLFEIKGLRNLELLQWSAKEELTHLQKFNIGLHPLPDEEWVYGKSGGKLVQYMAVGIPTIASAIGPNYEAIKQGYNGFLVKNRQEWIDKLELLILNESLRKEMGINARNFAIENYSLEANKNKYLEVFNY